MDVAIGEMKAKAEETSLQLSRELEHHSREHLELVSNAIAEVAKGIGRLPKQ